MSENHKHNSALPTKPLSSTKVLSNTLVLHIEKMDCPTEESLIRKKLEGMKGIESLDFNLIQRKLTVRHHLQAPESIIAVIAALDMEPVVEKPVVTDIVLLKGEQKAAVSLAATLSNRSDHPVSTAVSKYWKSLPDNNVLVEVTNFEALTGRGVKGQIDNQWYYLGNHRLVEELGICNPETEAALTKLEAEGKTAIVICNEATPLAVIAVNNINL